MLPLPMPGTNSETTCLLGPLSRLLPRQLDVQEVKLPFLQLTYLLHPLLQRRHVPLTRPQ